jgi:ABC-2 type transport system ATP-binding protein
MDDVVALCKRVIVVHHGRLLYDGGLADLAERMAPYKLIRVSLRADATDDGLDSYGEVVQREEHRVTLRVPRERAPERTADLVRDLRGRVQDLTLEDPAIEDIIDRVFSGDVMLSEAKHLIAVGGSGLVQRDPSPEPALSPAEGAQDDL